MTERCHDDRDLIALQSVAKSLLALQDKTLREDLHVSQPVFAALLNTSTSTVQKSTTHRNINDRIHPARSS